MKSRERAFIYSLLLVVVGFNVMLLIGRSATPAYASMEAWLDDLGPADRLILSGAEELTVQNADGRISWSDDAHSKAYSIGFVNVNKVVTALLDTSKFKEERETLTEGLQAEEAEWQEQFAAMQEKYADIQSADDPRAAEAQTAASTLQREFRQWQNAANQKVNEMAVNQLQQGYTEVIDAIDIVAEDQGVDLVLRFTPVEEELPATTNGETMLAIRMRPILKSPDGLDLTPDVMDELALDDTDE